MSTNDPIEALEFVNKEYIELLNSQEYRLGKRIKKLKSSISHFRINELFGYYKSIRSQKKIAVITGRNSAINVNEIFYNPGSIYEGKDKGVVYTCITGGYEEPQEPILLSSNFVLFSDEPQNIMHSTWKIRDIEAAKELQGNKINRYYKMHPSENLPGYRFTVYIDGNVQVVGDITRLFSIVASSKYGLAMHMHHNRQCAYVEAEACIAAKRGNPIAIKKQIERYRSEGFPENYGFCEATIIVVDNNNPNSKQLLDCWWKEFLHADSGRDQIALPYILWKNNLSTSDIGLLGNNLLFNPMFRITNLGDHRFR